MTYPTYGQPAGYPQQPYQPQYGQQPQGYPAAPAPQQPQYAPPAAPQPVPLPAGFSGDPWANSAIEQRAARAIDPATGQPLTLPTLRTIGRNRLVIIVPTKIERNIPNTGQSKETKPTQNRMTCDLIILDGQPFYYGGTQENGMQDRLGPFPIPGVIEGMWITQDGVIDRVKPEEIIGGGFRVGRTHQVKTAKGNMAWVLLGPAGVLVGNNPGERSQAEADAADAQVIAQLRSSGIWEAYKAGQLYKLSLFGLPNNGYQATPAQAAPQAAAPQNYAGGQPMSYGQPPQAAVQYGPPQAPQYGQQGMVAPVQNPASTAPQWPQQPPQQAPQAPVSAPAPDWTLDALPEQHRATYGPVWAGWTPEARAQVLAQLGIQPPQAPGAPAMSGAGVPPTNLPGQQYGPPPF